MQPTSASSDVLRGVPLQGTPLRLGRARAGDPVSAVADALDHAQALREERAVALREAREQGLREGRAEGLREGRAEGLREGLREGRAQAAEEIRLAVQQAVTEAVQPLEQEHARLVQLGRSAGTAAADALAAAHDEMAALCFETLCRILGPAAVQPQAVHAQLAHLLRQHAGRDVVLHLHPQDAQLMASRAGASLDGVRWVADEEVAFGGCILQAAGGGLDARLETMLSACKEALLEARRQQGHEQAAGGRP